MCVAPSELGVPSSVDLVCSDPAHLVASFTNGHIGLFNMETRQLVLTLESSAEPSKPPPLRTVSSSLMRSGRPGNEICSRYSTRLKGIEQQLEPAGGLHQGCLDSERNRVRWP